MKWQIFHKWSSSSSPVSVRRELGTGFWHFVIRLSPSSSFLTWWRAGERWVVTLAAGYAFVCATASPNSSWSSLTLYLALQCHQLHLFTCKPLLSLQQKPLTSYVTQQEEVQFWLLWVTCIQNLTHLVNVIFGGNSHATVLDLSHWFSFKWASSLLCKLPSWEAVFDLFSVHLQFVSHFSSKKPEEHTQHRSLPPTSCPAICWMTGRVYVSLCYSYCPQNGFRYPFVLSKKLFSLLTAWELCMCCKCCKWKLLYISQ